MVNVIYFSDQKLLENNQPNHPSTSTNSCFGYFMKMTSMKSSLCFLKGCQYLGTGKLNAPYIRKCCSSAIRRNFSSLNKPKCDGKPFGSTLWGWGITSSNQIRRIVLQAARQKKSILADSASKETSKSVKKVKKKDFLRLLGIAKSEKWTLTGSIRGNKFLYSDFFVHSLHTLTCYPLIYYLNSLQAP